jgi:hypothetical protein
MRLLEAIDRLYEHFMNAPEISVSDLVRIDEALLRASVGVIRVEADKEFGDERGGAVGELFRALEDLEAMTRAAKPVPLTEEVRLNRYKLYDQLDLLRDAVPHALAYHHGADAAPWTAVMAQVNELRQAVDDADRTMLTRRVKLEPDELRDRSARLRLAATQAFGPPDGHAGPLCKLYAALDTLDEIVATGDRTHHPDSLYGPTIDMRDAIVTAGAVAS